MGVTMQLKAVSESKLLEMIEEAGDPDGYLFEGDNEALDLSRSWYGLHDLICEGVLTGKGPLFNALMGGRPMEHAEELVRSLTAEQTREVARALESKSEAELTAAFNPQRMNEEGVYPSADWSAPGELDHLLERYRALKAYYQAAAENGEGMLLYSF